MEESFVEDFSDGILKELLIKYFYMAYLTLWNGKQLWYYHRCLMLTMLPAREANRNTSYIIKHDRVVYTLPFFFF